MQDQQLHEFRLRGEVDTPLDVLRSATSVNAELLQMDGEIGCVTPGAHADLLAFDGNPLEDLSVIYGETGGPAVVNAAMRSGKRSICAGPGNPPVVVDETANLSNAARDIIIGAAFDNNLLCIGEKQIFVVDAVFDEFMAQMARHGGYQLNREQLRRLADEAFSDSKDAGGCSQKVLNRDFIGVDASVLGKAAGVNAPDNTLVPQQQIFSE